MEIPHDTPLSRFEKILMLACVVVGIVLVVDSLAAMPPKFWGYNVCHIKDGLSVCQFSWRHAVSWGCEIGQCIIYFIILCNAHRLKNPHEYEG